MTSPVDRAAVEADDREIDEYTTRRDPAADDLPNQLADWIAQ